MISVTPRVVSGIHWIVLLAVIFFVFLPGVAAPRNKRIALIIGNADYALPSVWPKLTVPHNDAAAVSSMLRNLAFDVDPQMDLKRDAVDAAILRLQARAKDASVVVLYYAGHGITYDHVSYLVPTDAGIPKNADDLNAQLYSVQKIVTGLQSESRVVVLLLDACRENLLVQRLSVDADPQAKMLTTVLSRGVGHILDGITGPARTPTAQNPIGGGLYLVYATTPGGVALDSDKKLSLALLLESEHNSPFTAALLEHMGEPREIREVMTEVRSSVQSRTHGLQLPADESTLLGSFYLTTRPDEILHLPPAN